MSEKNSSYANNALLALSDEIQHIADNITVGSQYIFKE
jgi:hypothetical protein